MQVKDPEGLRRARKRRGLTQTELAFLCRCTQNTISLLEIGRMSTLSEDLALEISNRVGVDWEDLFVAREHAGTRRGANGVPAERELVQAVTRPVTATARRAAAVPA